MLLDWLRRVGFWTVDAIQGGESLRFYKDIKNRMNNGILNVEQLENLLSHAVSTTNFYKNFDKNDINSFPIINKNTIKTQWDDMYSSMYLGKKVHHMSTSGSTGTPFTIDWDMKKRHHQLAELIYFNEIAGHKLGQPFTFFRVWTKANEKSKLEQIKQNLTPLDILHLDDENLEFIRKRLKSRPKLNMCMGYASTHEALTKYLKSKGDTPDMFPIKVVISGSEVLSMQSKQLIKETIGGKIIDRYANEENGFIAETDDMSEIFNVNIASFYVEILKQDSDKPADFGEIGRIVVTDLYNFAVPLIRYDTGDLAIKTEQEKGWVTKITSIQGRRVDIIYDTKGRKLTGHTWSVYMWKYEKIKQYQFIQDSKNEYTLKVNVDDGIYTDDELIDYLKSILGEDAIVTIEHVSEIPVCASGKFKKTICNYSPKF